MEEVEDKFSSMLFQTEIERIKYLLKSYLRTRLFKVAEKKKKKNDMCEKLKNKNRLKNIHFIFYVRGI